MNSDPGHSNRGQYTADPEAGTPARPPRIRGRRRAVALGTLALVLVAGTLALTLRAGAARKGTSVGPDVTVIYLGSTRNYGASGGVRGYAVGTTSCNVGDEPVWWCNDAGDPFCDTNQHPVIAQNLYRLKDGRFQQIGMSWLKHGFVSTNTTDSACGPSCVSPPFGGDQLGIGCTDTYGAGLNGSRPLGMRSEVNAATGRFPYPFTQVSSSAVIDQRMRVKESDVDPANNPGALYWVEGHYIAADDAARGNAFNNASYRSVTVTGSTFNLTLQGSTIRELPAISVWPTVDPDVDLVNVDYLGVGTERFHVARKVTDLGGGSWHYEYAVHNMNSDRSARSFSVRFPGNTVISNTGFHDVEHHSGEPYAVADWTPAVNSAPGEVEWSTATFSENANANALRWGTMFSFWFDADAPPDGIVHTIGLFKPGTPTSVSFGIGVELFDDGFESGDTDRWSAAIEKPDT